MHLDMTFIHPHTESVSSIIAKLEMAKKAKGKIIQTAKKIHIIMDIFAIIED